MMVLSHVIARAHLSIRGARFRARSHRPFRSAVDALRRIGL